MQVGEGQREVERESQERLGLNLTNREIMTLVEIKSTQPTEPPRRPEASLF